MRFQDPNYLAISPLAIEDLRKSRRSNSIVWCFRNRLSQCNRSTVAGVRLS